MSLICKNVGDLKKIFKTITEKGGLLDRRLYKVPDNLKNITEIELEEMDAVTRRWEADALSDSWLSKNVRPISLVFLTLVYATGFFMEYDLDIINQLMLLVYGAYFGSRGLEKIRKL